MTSKTKRYHAVRGSYTGTTDDMEDITEADLRSLLTQAGEAGDYEQVVLCLEALGEDDGRFPEVSRGGTQWEAQTECARVIREAQANREG